MNNCKFCGKEISEGRVFCSQSCAGKMAMQRIRQQPKPEKPPIDPNFVLQLCRCCGAYEVLTEEGTCQHCHDLRNRVAEARKRWCWITEPIPIHPDIPPEPDDDEPEEPDEPEDFSR